VTTSDGLARNPPMYACACWVRAGMAKSTMFPWLTASPGQVAAPVCEYHWTRPVVVVAGVAGAAVAA